MKKILGPPSIHAATALGQTLAAMLLCITKNDPDGAETVRRGDAERQADLSREAILALNTVKAKGALQQRLVVATEVPDKPALKIVRP